MLFQRLKIREARRASPEATALSFDVPNHLAESYNFSPGQHVVLRANIDGKDIRRTYSIASRPGESLKIGVKRQDGGAFSNFAQDLKAGEYVEVMRPQGRFVYSGERNILLVASGSGITPVISIAAHALAAGSRVAMAFGNCTAESIMFRRELDALKDQFLSNFALVHVLSREIGRTPLLQGRIDGQKIIGFAAAGLFDPQSIDGAFICGPGGMIAECSNAIGNLGVDARIIRHERFLFPGASPPVRRSSLPPKEKANVEVRFDGAKYSFALESQDDSVIAAALRHGIELPFSCRAGMCCTCRCRVLSGQAEMAVNYSLEDWEIRAGFILACQSRPISESLMLDFDAV
ncbi:MAG: FAD-binding oxidoreductase [Albidovulum sp.]|nr:FAD-binding oxidoreductase [Albidovulum sp.]